MSFISFNLSAMLFLTTIVMLLLLYYYCYCFTYMKLRLRKKKRPKVLSFNLSPGLTNPKAHLLSCASWRPIVTHLLSHLGSSIAIFNNFATSLIPTKQ